MPTPKRLRILAITFGAVVCACASTSLAQTATSTSPVAGKVEARAGEASQAIHETGQAALNNIEVLWQRIDERRLKNRTPDELVAWVIMGLLVGGLLYRVGGRGQLSSILLGLVGSFLGGIVAHVAQLNFGLGPVLITYEDLLCTLVGGLLILGGARWLKLLKMFKPRVP